MADHAAQILSEIGALRGQLDRVENRLERVEGLGAMVAVLERQDQVDRDYLSRTENRIVALEAGQRALARLDHLEDLVNGNREAAAKLVEIMATKASTESVDAEGTRITALETDGARREGMSKALILVWTVLTAAPGMIGLAVALWKG